VGEEIVRYEPTSSALAVRNIDDALRLANLMAESGLVPDHLKGKPANCLLVIEQSSRWRMSPFAVAQCTSVIRGKLMFEGKLVAAVVNVLAGLEEQLDYEYSGSGRQRKCVVSGRKRGEQKTRTVEVIFENVYTDQNCWKVQPDQQLAYSGARVWARRHSPEVMLGVYSPDERFDDDDDGAPGATEVSPEIRAAIAASSPSPDSVAEGELVSQERRAHRYQDIEAPSTDEVECYRWEKSSEEWVPRGFEPKASHSQIALIHMLRKELEIQDDNYKDGHGTEKKGFRPWLIGRVGKDSSALLSKEEASEVIDFLENKKKRFGTPAQKREKQARRLQGAVNEISDYLSPDERRGNIPF